MVYAINTEFYCNCYYYCTCIQNFVFFACYRVWHHTHYRRWQLSWRPSQPYPWQFRIARKLKLLPCTKARICSYCSLAWLSFTKSILFCRISMCLSFMISMAAKCSDVCGWGHDSLPAERVKKVISHSYNMITAVFITCKSKTTTGCKVNTHRLGAAQHPWQRHRLTWWPSRCRDPGNPQTRHV